jgi:hypothetical protein
MTKYNGREFPFEECSFEESQTHNNLHTTKSIRQRMAEMMFGDLFAVAEVGKYYKVNVGSNMAWARLDNYLKCACEIYGKQAEFVTNENNRKIRKSGWVYIGF